MMKNSHNIINKWFRTGQPVFWRGKVPYTKYFCFKLAILALYLADGLGFAENTASALYHGFILLAYTAPLFGALLADSLLGKFRTIFYISIVYAIGQIVLTIASVGYDNSSTQM